MNSGVNQKLTAYEKGKFAYLLLRRLLKYIHSQIVSFF